MYCTSCGKDNREGTRFCVQCGTPMPLAGATPMKRVSGAADERWGFEVSENLKKLITAIVVAVPVVVAGISIVRGYIGTFSVKAKDALATANISERVVETDSYVYYTPFDDNGLYRADKSSEKAEEITDKDMDIIAAGEDEIYCLDSKKVLYRVEDNGSKLEKVKSFKNESIAYMHIEGRFNYVINTSGKLTKRLNATSGNGYSVKLYEAKETEYIMKAKFYDKYVYILLEDLDNNEADDNELVRVSLNNGKKDTLVKGDINDFSVAEDCIMCSAEDGIIRVDLDGKNEELIIDTEDSKPSLLCNNGYVYYIDDGDLYRFETNDVDTEQEIDCEGIYDFSGIPSGLVRIDDDDDSLIICDDNGEVITEVKP